MSPKQRAVIVAVLFALAGLVGYTVIPSSGEGSVPPVLTPSTSASPTADSAPLPPLPEGGCVAPAGMTKLAKQDPEDSQRPWKRNGAPKVSVTFAAPGISAEWFTNLNLGAQVWNQSPCLDVRVVNGPCPATGYCVTVHAFNKLPDGDDGNFDDKLDKAGKFMVGGDIQLLNTLSAGEKRNVAAHEMGHAVSLRHVTVKRDLMDPDTYEDVWTASKLDYDNLLYSYDKNSPLQK